MKGIINKKPEKCKHLLSTSKLMSAKNTKFHRAPPPPRDGGLIHEFSNNISNILRIHELGWNGRFHDFVNVIMYINSTITKGLCTFNVMYVIPRTNVGQKRENMFSYSIMNLNYSLKGC